MMGLYTESVSLALENRLTEVAKDYAKKPSDDDEKRKKLWMMVYLIINKYNKKKLNLI
jgi:hypothetical protein